MATKLTIRYKFLAVTTLLILVCLGTYLALATFIFKEDKRALVFDYNRSLVTNLSSELDNFLHGIGDKMQLVAFFHDRQDIKSKLLISELMTENKNIAWVGQIDTKSEFGDSFYTNPSFLKTYDLNDKFFSHQLSIQKPIPYSDIQKNGQAIWSATLSSDGPALIGYGKNVIEEDAKGFPERQYTIVAYIKADQLVQSLRQSRTHKSLIVNSYGEVLAHSNSKIMQKNTQVDTTLFNQAKKSQLRTQVLKYESNNDSYFGAFAKSNSSQVYVLTSVPEKMAFKAANDLVYRSILFGSILVSFAFLLAIFFSRSLTRPIERLVSGMRKVSEGDLETNIQVHSQDEIASLARHFNNMIVDLRKSRSELEEINKNLEYKVKERTVQLEERNQAVKEAQEALIQSTRLAAVGEVAGIAAHEVLNPLTSIISKLNEFKKRLADERKSEAQFLLDLKKNWSDDYDEGGFDGLLKSWRTPSKVKVGSSLWQEDLENIELVGNNILNEFDQLLEDSDFLLLESQRINRLVQSFRGMSATKTEVKQYSTKSLCHRSLQIMMDYASKHDVKLKTIYHEGSDLVWVDEDEFIQVLTNLIRNSIQSIQEKTLVSSTGEVVIETSVQDGQLKVSVKDNGIGFSKENERKVFSKKFTTKSKSEGTGIGLSVSRRLARAFNGDLNLAWTIEGQGAEFILEIPLVRAGARSA